MTPLMRPVLRAQVAAALAAVRQRLNPAERFRPAVVNAQASWLLLADGRPALRTARRTP